MKYLYQCRCGLYYGEKPETYADSNHPCNLCPQCDREIKPWEVTEVQVTEDQYENTVKHSYHPNWL